MKKWAILEYELELGTLFCKWQLQDISNVVQKKLIEDI